jgi:hypothetical protein
MEPEVLEELGTAGLMPRGAEGERIPGNCVAIDLVALSRANPVAARGASEGPSSGKGGRATHEEEVTMRARTVVIAVCLIGASLGQGGPALAQTPTISDAACQSLRERLSNHAQLSEGVRRSMGIKAPTVPATSVATAPTPAPPAGRAEAIRARLDQIPKERQVLEDQRLAAMVRFELSRAGQIQGQIQALDTEKSTLERELAALPTAPSTPAASRAASPPPASTTEVARTRTRCQDMPAEVDNALKIRRRELGAREEQTAAIPLTALKGQTSDEIAKELAGQFAPGQAAVTQIGLLDADGDGRLDGYVDVPAPGIFRLVRQRADGTIGVDVFAMAGSGATPPYGELTRRLDETTARQVGDKLGDMLATRPAGPVRTVIETAEFGPAYKQFEAGNFADAGRIGAAAGRSVEFENFRGERVRMIEIIGPISGGAALRRAVIVTQPNDRELYEETNTAVRPASYLRTDVEVARSRETRTTAGATVGSRSISTPVRFSLER